MSDVPFSRTCDDCVPTLQIQGGAWGWQGHRFWIHKEGEDPGRHPDYEKHPDAKPWTAEQHEEFHRKRISRRQQQRSKGRRS